jgi:hypothetical protein
LPQKLSVENGQVVAHSGEDDLVFGGRRLPHAARHARRKVVKTAQEVPPGNDAGQPAEEGFQGSTASRQQK